MSAARRERKNPPTRWTSERTVLKLSWEDAGTDDLAGLVARGEAVAQCAHAALYPTLVLD